MPSVYRKLSIGQLGLISCCIGRKIRAQETSDAERKREVSEINRILDLVKYAE